MKTIKLINGVEMPCIIMGTSTADQKGLQKKLIKEMTEMVFFATQNGIQGFDTSRDYANEPILGKAFQELLSNGAIKREELFITTKVGNSQQRLGNMEKQIDISLKNLKLDYIDLWLLHWPLPNYYINNWKQMCNIYKNGKVKAIGIANCRPRHIIELEEAGIELMPQVLQMELHPFRTVPKMRQICNDRSMQIEAYSANCLMLPFVKNNQTLNRIAKNHQKTITQIILKWHIQQGIIPIFSSMNKEHILSNIDIFDFELSKKDIKDINQLNIDYKFHPESLNCPGY